MNKLNQTIVERKSLKSVSVFTVYIRFVILFSAILLAVSFTASHYYGKGKDKNAIIENNNSKVNANGHEWVDMGLSVLWATCNVGASTPEGYGDYYSWGETSPQKGYSTGIYKWGEFGNNKKLKKYNTWEGYGIIDNKVRLELSDDAARMNWGGEWRTPTRRECIELLQSCDLEPTIINGIKGYRFISKKNGNSIFIPCAGCYCERVNSEDIRAGYKGYKLYNKRGEFFSYWSSTGESGTAFAIVQDGSTLTVTETQNFYNQALPIRPVINYSIENHQGKANGHEWVDMGLSVKWATRNVGALTSKDAGHYFAFGETVPKKVYIHETYKYCRYNEQRARWEYIKYRNEDYKLDPMDDAARVYWGGGWRMPTYNEVLELINECYWEEDSVDGQLGYYVISKKNGNSIFLPNTGFMAGPDISNVNTGDWGYYWFSDYSFDGNALFLNYTSHEILTEKKELFYGIPIRPVIE